MAIFALLVGMIFKIGAVPLLLEVVQCLLQVSFNRIFNTAGALVVITVRGITHLVTHPLHFLLTNTLAHSNSVLLYIGMYATV